MPKRDHVILVKPSAMDNFNFNATKGGSFVPLGVLYLAHSLEQHGYRVTIIDDSNEGTLQRINKLVDETTLCIGISTMSGAQLGNALWINDRIREQLPEIPIVWGGVHVTALPEESLRSGRIDTLVWGEGEQTLPMLLDAMARGDEAAFESIPGIGFRRNGTVRITSNSGYTPLDGVFKLPYHLLDMELYRRKLLIGAEREYPVYTSRGCPFKCTFCSVPSKSWPNTRVRQHSLDHIVQDIRTLVDEYGADMISYADEGFLFESSRLLGILEALDREGIRVPFRFSSRVDLINRIDEKTWDKFQEYGLRAVGAGIESGSPEMLDYMNKGISLDQIYKLDRTLTNRKLNKTYNFMISSPKETVRDLKMTLRLIADLAHTSLYSPYPFSVYRYIPLPRTKMFDDAVEAGLKPPTDIEGWTQFDTVDVMHRLDTVRPWITGEYRDFLSEVDPVMNRLFARFTGTTADHAAIEEDIRELEALIDRNDSNKSGTRHVRTLDATGVVR